MEEEYHIRLVEDYKLVLEASAQVVEVQVDCMWALEAFVLVVVLQEDCKLVSEVSLGVV